MKILNLYAGIGGNRKLWGDEAPAESQTELNIKESVAIPPKTKVMGILASFI